MCRHCLFVVFFILTTIIPYFLDQLTLLWTNTFEKKMLEPCKKYFTSTL